MTTAPRIGLVLGAGGVTGHAYHAGVLDGLCDATGWDPRDAEVIVGLDSQPEKAFALRLRDDAHRPASEGMLDLLRDAFNAGRPVQLDFIRTGCRIGDIVRVIEAS